MRNPIFSFSTQAFPQRSRFEAWRDEVNALFDINISKPAALAFNYRLATCYIGDLLMGCGTWEGQGAPVQYEVKRSRQMIRGDHLDHYYICLGISHSIHGTAGRTHLATESSDIYVLDLARELESVIIAGDTIILTIPRDVLSARLGHKDLHGHVVRGALGGLLADHMRALKRQISNLGIDEVPHAYQATLAMVAAALAPGASTLQSAEPHIDQSLLNRARHLIEQQLTSPDLSAASLAHQLGLSRARLYRLFAHESGVAGYIQSRRLIRANEQLQSETGNRQRISSLAFQLGFKSDAHFSRVFKARFGYSPSEARDRAVNQPQGEIKAGDMHTGFSLKKILDQINSN